MNDNREMNSDEQRADRAERLAERDRRSMSQIVQDECDSIDAAEDAAECENCGDAGHTADACTRYLACLRCTTVLPLMHNDPTDACPDCGASMVVREQRDYTLEALTGECPGCGQRSPYNERCPRCREIERAPQGTQPALFTHVPQLAGQERLEI